MSCQGCVYWNKQTEAYERQGMRGEEPILIPASGLCVYPVPSWVGYGLTAAHDGENCATCKPREY